MIETLREGSFPWLYHHRDATATSPLQYPPQSEDTQDTTNPWLGIKSKLEFLMTISPRCLLESVMF